MNGLRKVWQISASFVFLIIFVLPGVSWAVDVPLALFPIENYNQDVDRWLPPGDPHYNTPLVSTSYQKQRFQEFFERYFSTAADGLSPWSKNYVNENSESIPSLEMEFIEHYNNKDKTGEAIWYGANFRPYTKQSIEAISDNMDLPQFVGAKFNPQKRAILVSNTFLRALPTSEPYFYRFDLPGEGYPFDMMQVSALWAGTPAYMVGQTKDGAWSLIMAPGLIGWVDTAAVARVNDHFVHVWSRFAQHKLIAVTHTAAPVVDARNKAFLFVSYMGAVFPAVNETAWAWSILIPSRDSKGKARIRYAWINKQFAQAMPLAATPKNFATLLKSLKNRPYGWGGYNFYNDCSQELKSLFTPLGIWLPRHSSDQLAAGKQIDLSSASKEARLSYMLKKGHPLMTIVYVGGHVFLYLGSYTNPQDPDHASMAMSYQNIWGLKSTHRDSRWVIGQSVFFPILASYPENPSLLSPAGKSIFQLSYVDEWPER